MDPAIIDRLGPLAHRAREPAEPLRQRGHGVLLEIVHARQGSPGSTSSTTTIPRRRRRNRRLAAKPAVFPPLTRRQSFRPRRILVPFPSEEVFILRLLRPWLLPTTRRARTSTSERRRGTRSRRIHASGFHPLTLLNRHARKLPSVDLAPQPLFVLLPLVATVPVPHQRHRGAVPPLPRPPPLLPAAPALPEFFPAVVPAQFHPADLGGLERVHLYGPHKGDVHSQTAVQAGAREADEGAEFGGRPLR